MSLKQDHQAGDEVGHDVLQPEADSNAQGAKYHGEVGEIHTDSRKPDADTESQQRVVGHAAHSVQRRTIGSRPARTDTGQRGAQEPRGQRCDPDDKEHPHDADGRDDSATDRKELDREHAVNHSPDGDQMINHEVTYT